jgi:predicted ABC-type ATPase
VDDALANPCIYVLAGTNGAGKSSIGGAAFSANDAEYFNPDDAARRILSVNPHIAYSEANSLAWQEGLRLLERAIAECCDYAFETTLGGTTITDRLGKALSSGIQVRVWYAGLRSAELHIERVQARVARGGHDIPKSKIRERFDRSRQNLIRLLPALTELRVYDNSFEADPNAGFAPEPTLVLHVLEGKIVGPDDLTQTPDWAKPIVAAAMSLGN